MMWMKGPQEVSSAALLVKAAPAVSEQVAQSIS